MMDEEYLSYEEEEDYDYSSDELDDLEEPNNEEESDLSSRKPTSQVITKQSLVEAQKEVLIRVMELLTVKENQARILLIHYQWNVDKLFSVFVDKGKDHLFASSGLTVFDPDSEKTKKEKKMNCEICMEDDLSCDVMTRMECGHSFCNGCWKEHFTVKINDGESKMITCMAYKCKVICDEDVVRKLVEPSLAEKFDRFLIESYVEGNKMVKWCPSIPHCGNAIRKLEDNGDDEIECSCGHQFCFSCLSETHSPCSCLIWKLWYDKFQSGSESVNWITVHTKLCPKCTKPVEKSSGCNLMRCRCGQYFCWLCGGATGGDHTWSTIAGHSCGRYNEDDTRKLERAKRDLDRYLHYHYRYKVHWDSSKLEDKLRMRIIEKAVLNSSTKDHYEFKTYDWVINGVNRLFRSRRILMYTYAFAFYMFGELFKDEMSDKEKEMKKNLFEDQQQQLESNVEKLSKILAENFEEYDSEGIIAMKMQVNTMNALVDKLCKQMYECIENDLLGPIQVGNHNIAPYKSKGIQQAAEFCADLCQSSDCGSSGSS